MGLTADRGNGVHNLDAEIPDADVNAALDCLSKLDGERHTLQAIVTLLNPKEDSAMLL